MLKDLAVNESRQTTFMFFCSLPNRIFTNLACGVCLYVPDLRICDTVLSATQYFLGVHAGGSDMVCLAAFTARAQRAASLITSLLINVCDCLNVAVGVALPGRLSLRLARRGGARQYGLPFRLRCTTVLPF